MLIFKSSTDWDNSLRFFTWSLMASCSVRLDSEAMECAAWYFWVSRSSSDMIGLGRGPSTAQNSSSARSSSFNIAWISCKIISVINSAN